MIYYRRYIERFQLDTQDLSNIQLGVYDRLLDYYYGKEKPIPFGKEAGITRAVTAAEREALKLMLDQFFTRGADGWHNKRADHEIAMAKKARANGAKNGSDGGPDVGPDTPPDAGPESPAEIGIESRTGTGHPSSLLTKTSLSTSQPSTRLTKTFADDASRPGRGKAAWEAYSLAYLQRYQADPVRNARVNKQIASFVDAVGAIEAPLIAAFYLTHNRAQYVSAKHPTNLLLRDAEGLRTEWVTNRKVTDTEGRQADRTQATAGAFQALLEEASRDATH